MKKNVASQLISAQMVTIADGSDQTTGTCNVAVEIDGAPGTGGTATHIANGKWEYTPIQGDTNGDYLTFQFVISGAVTATVQVYTAFPQTVDNNVLAAGATGFTAIDTVVDAILVDTNELQTDWTDGGRLDLILDAILADTGTDGVAISATTANQLADALLNRDWTSVSDTNARTALNALRFLRNKYSISGTTLTVTKEDDSTSAWTSALTTDAAADPVTASDPV